MEKLRSQAETILKAQFASEGLEIVYKEDGRPSVDFLVNGKNENRNELFLQPMTC